MWGTEWPKFRIVIQGKYFLRTMTYDSLTENEEHGIPSQILKTIFGLHASGIFRPQYVWFPVHLKGLLIPLWYETLVVNWQNWLFTLFHQSSSVLSPNPIRWIFSVGKLNHRWDKGMGELWHPSVYVNVITHPHPYPRTSLYSQKRPMGI